MLTPYLYTVITAKNTFFFMVIESGFKTEL